MKKNIGKILAVILVVALLATVLCACNAESYQKKLEKENSELRKEVEFLKKAAAYFAVDQKKNTRS